MSKVYIVGAGPGDISYLTVRARDVLALAEVLIYDALVDRSLLGLVPRDCVLVNVGKRGGQPSMLQAEIDLLLVEYAQTGKVVVRLKSGDPFIFGRVTAELDALMAAGCDYEVVPGLSTALVAPLLAGIPLTDPVLSRGFAVVTAHLPDDLDWDALARMPTVVILMGARQLREVVAQLLKHDRPANTPIAIVRWAGTPQQQVWVSDLGQVISATAGIELSPAVIIVGQVVRLRTYLRSGMANAMIEDGSDRTFLAGKTVLVTRASGQASEFSEMLRSRGAKVLELPTLEIVPPSSWDDLDREIHRLANFDWLILTSTNGVDAFFSRLQQAGKDSRALAGIKIAVVGQKTAQSLQQYGITPDFIPPDFIADALVSNFPGSPAGQRILFPRVETGGREVLVKELTNLGAIIVEVAAYQSRCPDSIDPSILSALQQQFGSAHCEDIDIITFASSKTVKHFCQLIGTSLPSGWQDQVLIASIGPQTSATCRELFGKVDIEATEYTLPGLVTALEVGIKG